MDNGARRPRPRRHVWSGSCLRLHRRHQAPGAALDDAQWLGVDIQILRRTQEARPAIHQAQPALRLPLCAANDSRTAHMIGLKEEPSRAGLLAPVLSRPSISGGALALLRKVT